MNSIFTLQRPLQLRFADGSKAICAELFRHAHGLVWFELYWHLDPNVKNKIHVIEGDIKGQGPWKIADTVITLVGCHGTDAQMAVTLSDWENYLVFNSNEYPSKDAIEALAKQFGAVID